MIYKKLNDLPQEIQHELPFEAQKIFLEAYRDGWDDFESPLTRDTQTTRHEAANRFAWLAVKDDFKKTKKDNGSKKNLNPELSSRKAIQTNLIILIKNSHCLTDICPKLY